MASKQKFPTPKRKPHAPHGVTLAQMFKDQAKDPLKKAMIQQANDELTESIMPERGTNPLARLGLLNLGVENMTTMVEPAKGKKLPLGWHNSGREPNTLLDKSKKVHTGDPKFRKQGKSYVAVPIRHQKGGDETKSQFRDTARHEYLHAGQAAIDKDLIHYKEAVAITQDTKTGTPHEKRVANRQLTENTSTVFVDPASAKRTGKKWLPIQQKAAKIDLERRWKVLEAKHKKRKK